MYIKRKIEQTFLDLSDSFPAVMIAGARQVGKTTLLKQLMGAEREYVSLEIPGNRLMAVEDPEAFLEQYQPPVIIDEFQHAPNLLPHIKAHIDEHQVCGDFWLAGSQNIASLKNVFENLSDNMGMINLFSLSHSEITQTLFDDYETSFEQLVSKQNIVTPMTKSESFVKILTGGMPYIYDNVPPSLQNYFDAYFQNLLIRDIKDLSQTADELLFYKFMQVCSQVIAEQVNYAEIARRADISISKAKEWVDVLSTLGIIIFLPPYSHSTLKKPPKIPKMYFMDTGLLCYLRGIMDTETLARDLYSGNFFENYVVSELYKSYTNVGENPPLYYYQDVNTYKEIDLVIERDGLMCPVEINESTDPDKKSMIRNFNALDSVVNTNMRIGTGNIICNGHDIYPLSEDEDFWAVPHWFI
ncbi:MAG: DUF4143 domain-containing protein [Peptococcaceae bacterium]|nr:DUF4143 domain-containing protein [Peptococcaceae bacterium]